MARIAGIDLPKNKRIGVALTYIYGIGRPTAWKIINDLGIPESKRTDDLTEEEVRKIRELLDTQYKVEGDLRRIVQMNIKRLRDISCYRGIRHRKGLPVRGQRTHTNARTRKGPRRAITSKK
ncbi:MAG: 30S ribosomal protein S13 [Myxococcota bacterium]|nr:30S ribosomal protein S13 [Myxococcota bacterium]